MEVWTRKEAMRIGTILDSKRKEKNGSRNQATKLGTYDIHVQTTIHEKVCIEREKKP